MSLFHQLPRYHVFKQNMIIDKSNLNIFKEGGFELSERVTYKILTELNDNPSDLHTMKQEISKIIGLSLVVKNKLEGKKNQSDSFVTIYKLFSYYIETYDFSREIDILAQIYFTLQSVHRNAIFLRACRPDQCRLAA